MHVDAAVEWWSQQQGSTSKLPYRLPLCGHVYLRHISLKAADSIVCTVCGCVHSAEMQCGVRDLGRCVDSSWQSARLIKCRRLKANSTADFKGHLTSLESVLVQAACAEGALVLPDWTFKPENRVKKRASAQFLVLRLATCGSTLKSGAFLLSDCDVLLLHGHGLHFREATFTGGRVVCSGADYSGSFHNCCFRGCMLHATSGASVAVSHCNFTSSSPAILASGSGTRANVRDTRFSSCTPAMLVEHGAAATAWACFAEKCAGCVIVNDSGSHATCGEFEMHCEEAGCGLGAAVSISEGSLQLLWCTLRRATTGVRAAARCAVEFDSCQIVQCEIGAHLMSQAAMVFRNVEVWGDARDTRDGGLGLPRFLGLLVGHHDPHKPSAAEEGAIMQAEGCTVRSNVQGSYGLSIMPGSHASASRCLVVTARHALYVTGGCCRIAQCETSSTRPDAACMVRNHGRLRVDGGAVTGTGGAVEVAEESVLSMSDCAVASRSPSHASKSPDARGKALVRAYDRATVRLLRVNVRKASTATGVSSVQSKVKAVDCRITNERPVGLNEAVAWCNSPDAPAAYTCNGGQLDVAGGCVSDSVSGVLVSSSTCTCSSAERGVHSSARLVGVAFRDCGDAVQVGAECVVVIRKCTFRAPRNARLVGEAIAAGGDDVSAVIDFVSRQAAVLLHAASGCMEDCVFEDCMRGVSAIETPELAVRRCTFGGSAVRLSGSAGMMINACKVVEQCTFSRLSVGVCVVQEVGKIQDCQFGPEVLCGVRLQPSAQASLTRSRFDRCWIGMAALQDSFMVAGLCEFSHCALGIEAMHGRHESLSRHVAEVELASTPFFGNAATQAAAGMCLRECRVLHSECGVALFGAGMGVVKECVVEDCHTGMFVAMVAAQMSFGSISRCHASVVVDSGNSDSAQQVRDAVLRVAAESYAAAPSLPANCLGYMDRQTLPTVFELCTGSSAKDTSTLYMHDMTISGRNVHECQRCSAAGVALGIVAGHGSRVEYGPPDEVGLLSGLSGTESLTAVDDETSDASDLSTASA